jgi:ribose transport system substrate-binding protein
MIRRLIAAMAVLSLGVAFAACGSSDREGSADKTTGTAAASAAGATTGTATEAEAEATSVAFESPESDLPVGYPEPKGDKALTIGFASPTSASEAVQVLERSMAAAAKELGGKVVILDAGLDVDKQVSSIQQLVAQKVDAIVVFPLDPHAVVPAIEQAKKAGIPRVAVEYNNQDPNEIGPFDTQIVQGTDRLAYLEVQQAFTDLGEGAKVVQIGINVPAPTLIAITAATKKWAQKFGLDYQGRGDNPSDDIAGGEEVMAGLLAKYPDAEGVLAYNDASAIGASAAARTQGRDMAFYGNYGGASDGISAIENGRIDGTVVFDQPGVGRYAVWGAYDLIENPDTALPKTVLPGPPVVVTKDNVSEFSGG